MENRTTNHKPTNLLDINTDCIEKIFGFLTNIQDLLNMAEIDSKFHYPANIIYKKYHGNKYVEIMWFGDEMLFFIGEDYIGINTFEKFLNIFGDSIPALELEYFYNVNKKNRYKYTNTFNSITKHTLKSLKTINLREFPRGWLEKFSKTLPKIEKITLKNCHLGGKMSTLGKIFPNVREIYCFNCTKFNIITARFKNLTVLKINTHTTGDKTMIKLLIKFNKNIKHFQIIHPDQDLLKFITKELKSLETLELTLKNETYKNNINLHHLKNLYINSETDKLPFNINSLQSFNLGCIQQHNILNELNIPCEKITVDIACWFINNINDRIITNFINNTNLTRKIIFRYPPNMLRNYLRDNTSPNKWTIKNTFEQMIFTLNE